MPSFAKFGNDLYSGRRSYDFVGNRRRWYAIAAIVVLVSLSGLALRGLNAGIEFRGGSEFRVSGVQDTGELTGQRAVTSVVPGADVRVSTVGTDGVRIQTNRLSDTDVEKVRTSLAADYDVSTENITSSFVGPSWGKDVSRKALTGLGVFLALVALVITLYFRTWKMAVAALVALAHDLVITVGVYAIVGFEVTPASVIGFLTILGYSLYDTVVVFDKVRENTEHVLATTRRTFGEAANRAVNQTLVRSINTSIVALLPVGAILFIGSFLLGAGTLKDISLALFVGIAVGTYSSIFIATPLLVHLREREPELAAQAERVHRKRAEAAAREADPSAVAVTGRFGADAGKRVGLAPGVSTGSRTSVPAGAGAGTGPGGTGQRVQPRRKQGRGRSGRKR
ncbi:MAG: protein translocase subunit SecF [Kineosporiaceae bacterium]